MISGRLSSLLFPILIVLTTVAPAQPPPLAYHLQYSPADASHVQVRIEFSSPIPAPAVFVMPRTYPGGYRLVLYDSFIEHQHAISGTGDSLTMQKDLNGPRWNIGRPGESIAQINYQVDIARMERELLSAVDTSKVRPSYLGILGYSVFGYADGFENREIQLQISAPEDWPVLTTLSPSTSISGIGSGQASNYYALADSEVLMGPGLQIHYLPGKIRLTMAVYAEGEEDTALEEQLAREALDKVQAYFGTTPFQQYTVQLEVLRPLAGHDYGFSQEHLDSGTFSFSIARALTQGSLDALRQARLFNYAHHMAHCWIPKRAYGVGYMPFIWEMPPVIDTIWFNEGFARYAAIEALADAMPAAEAASFREMQLASLRKILTDAPRFIQQTPLLVLSREASFMYSSDFRVAQNIFARGALMAAEMDDRIRNQTHGKKSLRDALRYLLQRSEASQRPFETEELSGIFAAATGADVRDIFEHWLKPNPTSQKLPRVP